MSEEDYTMDNGAIEITYQDVSEYILVDDPLSDYLSTSHWCSITCNEKIVNVSDEILIHYDTPIVHIHGNEEGMKGTLESSEEYNACNVDLHYMGNDQRDEETESIRANIGNGISLAYIEGKVYLTNNSGVKVYYQSWIGNDILNHHKSTVVEGLIRTRHWLFLMLVWSNQFQQVKSNMQGIVVFDLAYFAEYLNVRLFGLRCYNCLQLFSGQPSVQRLRLLKTVPS